MEPEKKLASAEELKGKKSGAGRNGKGNRTVLMTVILLVLLVLAAAVYFFSGQTKPQKTDGPSPTATEQAAPVTLIDRARDEVLEVTVEQGNERYTVVNGKAEETNTRYYLKEWPDFDMNQAKASALLRFAASLQAERLVTDNASALDTYHLDAPLARVAMRYADATESVWLIGSKAPTSAASYIMEENTEKVYLLGASAVSSLSARRNDLHTLAMPGVVIADQIRTLIIERPGQDTVELGYSEEGASDKGYSISALRLRQPFYYLANAERASEMFSGAAGLTISSYAGSMDELTGTGLENGGGIRLTVTQSRSKGNLTDLDTFVYRIGDRTTDGASVYMKVDDSSSVYLADASSVAFLENAIPAYLVDQFTNLIYINAVQGIEICSGEDRWLLEIQHPEDEKASDIFRFNGTVVQDASAFRELYRKIVGMTSAKLSDDYHVEGEVLLSVRYALSVEPGELLVEYLAYDENYCAVRRDGLTLFLTKREQVDALLDALQQFSVM